MAFRLTRGIDPSGVTVITAGWVIVEAALGVVDFWVLGVMVPGMGETVAVFR
jgi:hypothetical protein